MRNQIVSAVLFFVMGAVAGSVTTCNLCKKYYSESAAQEIINQESVTVEPIKGNADAIKQSSFKVTGKKITFKTATKEAEIKTTIDKKIIPEYRKWTERVHGIQATYGGLIYKNDYRNVVGINYVRRFGRFSVGLGPMISWYVADNQRNFGGGINVLMEVWF